MKEMDPAPIQENLVAMLANERLAADPVEFRSLGQDIFRAECCESFLADAEDALRTTRPLRHGHRQRLDETISEQVILPAPRRALALPAQNGDLRERQHPEITKLTQQFDLVFR
jgi:hypothetical protein